MSTIIVVGGIVGAAVAYFLAERFTYDVATGQTTRTR